MSVWGVALFAFAIAVGHRALLVASETGETHTHVCVGDVCLLALWIKRSAGKVPPMNVCVRRRCKVTFTLKVRDTLRAARSQRAAAGDSPLQNADEWETHAHIQSNRDCCMYGGRICTLMQAADCTRRRMLINLRPDNGGKRIARARRHKKFSPLYIVCVASRRRRRRLICRPSGFTVGKVAHESV